MQKNTTHATTACAFDRNQITMTRAQPMTLDQLLAKKRLMYRSQMDTPENKAVPTFVGPGGVTLQEPEVSFGLLYATSLRRALANDLRQQAISMGCSNSNSSSPSSTSTFSSEGVSSSLWHGSTFLQLYSSTSSMMLQKGTILLGGNCSIQSPSQQQPQPLQSAATNNQNTSTIQFNNQQQAMALDASLWNASDWTWSFFLPLSSLQLIIQSDNSSNISSSSNGSDTTAAKNANINNDNNNNIIKKTRGNVNRDIWRKDRFAACNASYHNVLEAETATTTAANKGGMAIRPITLCEPAPTAGLQTLCQAMIQYRTDIQTINCEIMGKGACLYRPGTFYVPYVWSPTNQEFAADTVIGYYQSILKQPRFSNEKYTQLCPSRNSLLDRLTVLSQAQAQQCPAYQIEYLKGIMQSIKNIGHDLLYMGYCLVMFMANILGMAFSQDAFSMNSMLQMAQSYLVEFVTTAEEIIMPLLDAMINLLFGVSPVGKVLKDALYYLCEYYNYIIKNIYIPIWCVIIRPALYVIFNALEGIVVPFNRDAANKIDAVWVAIAGGDGGISISDTTQCIGSLKININCGGDTMAESGNANGQTFKTAALATLCWTDSASISSSMGGAGVLGGVSAASYLSCTASDTCALDPLNFDSSSYADYTTSKQNLVPCISCPSIEAETGAQRFGCDTYLKRCTCGIASNTPAQCMSNSDCSTQQQQAICAVASNLDLVSQASTHVPCNECGSMGMQPACVMSGNEAICACVAIAQIGTLQACNNRGQSVSLLQATGQCLATSNYDLQTNSLSSDLVLDFGTLTIVPCAFGMSSDNGCIGISLPLASGGGQYARSLVVILLFSSSSTSARRRHLLNHYHHTHTQNNTNDTSQVAATSSALLALSAPPTAAIWASSFNNNNKQNKKLILDENQATVILQNWTHTPLFCRKAISAQNREQVKWCIHWRFAAISVLSTITTTFSNHASFHYNNNHDAIFLSYWPPFQLLFDNASLFFAIASNQDAVQFLLRQHRAGLFPALLDTSITLISDSVQALLLLLTRPSTSSFSHNDDNNTNNNNDNNKTHQITSNRLLLQAASAATPPTTTTRTKILINSNNRRELVSASAPSITLSSCAALDQPLKAIASAFWDTVRYYQYISLLPVSADNNSNSTINTLKNDNNITNLYESFIMNATSKGNRDMSSLLLLFTLPSMEDSTTIKSQQSGVLGDLADFVFGGNGRAFIAAFTSPDDELSQNSSSSNFFTGRHLLKELSFCNYTTLTFKKNATSSVSLLYIAIFIGLLFLLFATFCVPSSSSSACLSWILWTILFPMVFFWLAYGTSPLCWPMIPPSLPHDIAAEITSIVPESLEIPRFLVEEHCTIRGLLSDGTYDPRCFKQCEHAPFLMQSWQVLLFLFVFCFILLIIFLYEKNRIHWLGGCVILVPLHALMQHIYLHGDTATFFKILHPPPPTLLRW